MRWAAALAVALLVACSGAAPDSTAASPSATAAALDPDFGAGQDIRVTDEGPMPLQLVAIVGRPITWTNATDEDITIRSTSGEINSRPVPPGGTFRYTPEASVSIVYETSVAPRKRGAIQVEPVEPAGDS